MATLILRITIHDHCIFEIFVTRARGYIYFFNCVAIMSVPIVTFRYKLTARFRECHK